MTKKNKITPNSNLWHLHQSLTKDLLKFEKQLPNDAEDLTEAFERYAKVIMLLIRSMDLLMLREENLLTDITSDQKPKEDVIEELERVFDRINAENTETKISK